METYTNKREGVGVTEWREEFDTSHGIMELWGRGHLSRMGHELQGYWTRRGERLKMNITCCTAGERGEY